MDQATELLERLVAFETVSDKPVTEIASFLANYAEDLGFRVWLDKDPAHPGKTNVICEAGPQNAQGLILSGHMDVVPTKGQPWKTDPFKLVEKDGRLYGRGTSDMKGFLAATLAACAQINIRNLKNQLVLFWTHDEEVGCLGSAHLAQTAKDHVAYWPKQAVIGEPTEFQIFRMHPGHVTIKIVTTGRANHSSKPDLGASAIKAMSQVLNMLSQLETDLMKERRFEDMLERPYVTVNVGQIGGGQAVNIVPDHCEVIFGYRPLPGDQSLALFERIQSRLGDLKLPPGTSVFAEPKSQVPALLTNENTPLQKLIVSHAQSKRIGAAPFATDGGNLSALGIESLIFGPGTIDVAHQADEYIEKAALIRATSIIESLVNFTQ